jgi:hypothetical protein
LQLRTTLVANTRAIEDSEEEREKENISEDSDDDDIDIDLDDMLTPYEEERLAAMKKAAQEAALAASFGFAQHIQESEQHLEDMIYQGYPIVLHICNVNSRLCARIDLVLEDIAKRFIGTLFRRMTLSPLVSAFKEKWELPAGGECLAIFNKKLLVIATSNLRQFGDDDEVFPRELERYLANTKALETSIADLPIVAMTHEWGAPGEESGDELDGEDNAGSYCGTPGCTRRFPHEHVGTAADGSRTGGATLTGSIANEQGAEALAKDFCFKI